MENKACDFTHLSTSFVKLIMDYNEYATKVWKFQASSSSSRGWTPPRHGWIKANFDAHIGSDCRRGFGVVFRNHEGTLLAAATCCVRSNIGVEEAEIKAALFALEVAHRMEYDNIILEGDAQQVINTINRKDTGLAPIFSLYDLVYAISDNFVNFECSHVRRCGNTLAHMVERWDTGIAHEKICMDPFPASLRALAELDLL